MKDNIIDLRTKRTINLIKISYLALLSKNNFDTISVTDICQGAMIHRTTFYKHFDDKYDLTNYILNDLEKNFVLDEKDKYANFSEQELYLHIVDKILCYCEKNKELFKKILQNNKDSALYFMITQAVERNARVFIKSSKNTTLQNIPIDFIVQFMITGLVSVGFWWILNDTKLSKNDVLSYTQYMITNILKP